jgi:hypothetical protein
MSRTARGNAGARAARSTPNGRIASIARSETFQLVAIALDARRPELEHRVHQREEERGIRAGADEMVARSRVRGLGAHRIDHHDFPPRSRIAFSRLATSGTLMMLPLEAIGFAPRISQYAVWSRRGSGT